jgi:hypothetical protein
MAILELFSTSFLISIGIIIIVGLLFAFISYKISEQDHKISSMLGLISTMAQELDFFRNKLASKLVSQNNTNLKTEVLDTYKNRNNDLIEVSDNEDENEDDDDEDNDEDDDDEDDDDNEEDDNEEDDNEEDDNEYYEEDEDNKTVKVLNIHLDNDKNNMVDISDDINDLDQDADADADGDDDDDDDEDDDGNLLDDEDSLYSKSAMDSAAIKSIHLEETDNLIKDTNMSFLKSIHITNLEDHENENDYKKMSVQKLRTLVSKKGLSSDVSKLKKNELLQLLK